MGRRKKPEGTVSGYFRKVFAERPDWLGEKSNDPTLARYREDHGMAPGAEIDKKIKQNLANIKSVLRKKGRKKRGRPKKVAVAMTAAVAAAPVAVVKKAPVSKLDALEESIDDCLTTAKSIDRDGLHDVIMLLRRARNAVVWKIGQ
jgi:hypothetical protein